MRAAIKDSIMPLLCSLAAQGTAASGAAVLEPYKQLVSLGVNPSPFPLTQPEAAAAVCW